MYFQLRHRTSILAMICVFSRHVTATAYNWPAVEMRSGICFEQNIEGLQRRQQPEGDNFVHAGDDKTV
jgi:hypothetical protein